MLLLGGATAWSLPGGAWPAGASYFRKPELPVGKAAERPAAACSPRRRWEAGGAAEAGALFAEGALGDGSLGGGEGAEGAGERSSRSVTPLAVLPSMSQTRATSLERASAVS